MPQSPLLPGYADTGHYSNRGTRFSALNNFFSDTSLATNVSDTILPI